MNDILNKTIVLVLNRNCNWHIDCPDNQMNTAPQNSSFEVTLDDLRMYDWPAELAAASRRECYAFNDVLIAKAKVLS